MFAFNYAPLGWVFCDGSLVLTSSNLALFSLLGFTYGGTGTSFALPDLRSRVPLDFGQGTGLSAYALGQSGGVETVTLTTAQIPSHGHNLQVNPSDAITSDPTQYQSVGSESIYHTSTTTIGSATTNTGGGLSHPNIQPYLALNFCICTSGIFPPRP